MIFIDTPPHHLGQYSQIHLTQQFLEIWNIIFLKLDHVKARRRLIFVVNVMVNKNFKLCSSGVYYDLEIPFL